MGRGTAFLAIGERLVQMAVIPETNDIWFLAKEVGF